MTTTKSDEDRTTAAAGVDLTALAVGVVAAVTGPRGPAPAVERVADALARRAAGATYAEIAAATGVSEKRAASWCRAAARIDDRFDPRAAKPRRVRAEAAAKAPLEKLIGWRPRPGTRAVLESRAESEGRSITAIVQAAVDAYLQRRTAGVAVLVREQLRKGLKTELRAVADAVGAQELEIARQGNNLNQLARFVNRYRELPVAITDELEANRRELEANRRELARLTEAVEDLVGEDR